jgi:hypothetical protein
MASPSWTQVADDFQNDGSLRDIRVVGAGSETWPAVYSLITAWEPPSEAGSHPCPLALRPFSI